MAFGRAWALCAASQLPARARNRRTPTLVRAALLALSCAAVRSVATWLCPRLPSAGRTESGSAWHRTAARAEDPQRSEGSASADAPSEPDPLLEEAKMALETAKLRLEAAKLREETEKLRSKAAAATVKVAEQAPAPAAGEMPVVAEATSQDVAQRQVPDVEASTEASALVGSTVLQRAAGVLLRLRRAEGAAFEALVSRVCEQLEAGEVEWGALMGADSTWQAAGVEPSEAEEALRALAALLTPRGSPAQEVKTASQRDRKAVLKILLYDQLPEASEQYADLLQLEDGYKDELVTELTIMDPTIEELSTEVREAVRFTRRLELVPEAERTGERLRRLYAMPLVSEAASLAQQDASLVELGPAVKPFESRLYAAMRQAQLRARPKEEITDDKLKVVTLDFNILQLLGALVAIAVLAYGAAQVAKGSFGAQSGIGGSDMPMYSLRPDTTR
mmetsp:Transcript_50860/g.157470  ORF Transcript_50860/g.157470 Transcript_50860/m.157470 type:complete len:449 (+) Transcript_50860:80-1426(+)